MPMANYNGGFTDGISIRGIPLNVLHPGKVFWVSNSTVLLPNQKPGSDGNPGTFNAPFATLDYAVGKCTANRGDIIMVKPGHTEVVSAAAGIVFDVAGIAIVGMGSGSLRPKISFTTATTADIDITAANTSFYNIEFQANFADVAAAIDISGVAGISFDSCYFTEAGTDLNFVNVIDIATGASDMSFTRCKFITGDAENDSHITGTNPAISGLYISDCFFTANVAQTSVKPLIDSGSGALTNVVIKDSFFRSNIDGAKFIYSTSAANSGIISNCYFSSIDGAGAVTAGFDFSGGHMFECYVAGEVDTYGIIGGGSAYNNA
jgi:hypothetical protein